MVRSSDKRYVHLLKAGSAEAEGGKEYEDQKIQT